MSYTPPTAAEFKARFPEFIDVPDAQIDVLLMEAGLMVDNSWSSQDDFTMGRLYLAAHLLSEQQEAGSGEEGGGGMVGDVASESFGPLSITYNRGGSSSSSSDFVSTYSTTFYGRRFLALLRVNKPAIVAI